MTGIMRPHGSALERGLMEFIGTLKPNIVMAEVGCFAGEATRLFLSKSEKVFCIDPWSDYTENNGPGAVWEVRGLADIERIFDEELQNELKSGKVVKYKMSSVDAARSIPEMFDLVYLDGNHSLKSVLEDISAWKPRVKQGGILSGHDYDRVLVQDAVRNLVGNPDRVFEDGTWMKQL